MPINSEIPLMGTLQGYTLDEANKPMVLADLIATNRAREAIRRVFAQAPIGPDGAPDRRAVVQGLYRINPAVAQATEQHYAEIDKKRRGQRIGEQSVDKEYEGKFHYKNSAAMAQASRHILDACDSMLSTITDDNSHILIAPMLRRIGWDDRRVPIPTRFDAAWVRAAREHISGMRQQLDSRQPVQKAAPELTTA